MRKRICMLLAAVMIMCALPAQTAHAAIEGHDIIIYAEICNTPKAIGAGGAFEEIRKIVDAAIKDKPHNRIHIRISTQDSPKGDNSLFSNDYDQIVKYLDDTEALFNSDERTGRFTDFGINGGLRSSDLIFQNANGQQNPRENAKKVVYILGRGFDPYGNYDPRKPYSDFPKPYTVQQWEYKGPYDEEILAMSVHSANNAVQIARKLHADGVSVFAIPYLHGLKGKRIQFATQILSDITNGTPPNWSEGGSVTKAPEVTPSLTVSPDELTVKVNETARINVLVTPNAPVEYKGYDKNLISVATNGSVLGIAKGSTTVTVDAGGGLAKTVKVTVTDDKKTVSVSPGFLDMNVGETESISAITEPANEIGNVTWHSQNPEIVSVDGGGNIKALAIGKTVITAELPGAEEFPSLNTCVVEVKEEGELTISPDGRDIAKGESLKLDAKLDGGTVPAGWSSSNTAIATVSSGGSLKGVAKGDVTITAVYDGQTAEARFTVKEGELVISPDGGEIAKNDTLPLTAKLDGETVSAIWSSSNTAIATVSSGGSLKGVAKGDVTITAVYDGQTAEARFTVKEGELVISPNGGEITKGDTLSLTAKLDGKTVSANWSSSSTAIATVSSGGSLKGVAKGNATITAVYDGQEAEARFTVKEGELVISPNGGEIDKDDTLSLTAKLDGKTVSASWSSSNTAIATVSSGGSLKGVAKGNVIITAVYDGQDAAARFSVTETETSSGSDAKDTATETPSGSGARETLTISPVPEFVPAGSTVSFESYLNGRLISADFTSDTGRAEISSSGRLIAHEPGRVTITANYKGITAEHSFTVTDSADQPSSWAVIQVNSAIEKNLVPENLMSNYTDAITRAEFCALAVQFYETVTGTEITGRAKFNDTSDVNVEKAAYRGIASGMGNNRFDPSSGITREQAATMLTKLIGSVGTSFPRDYPKFADADEIADWAYDSVGRVQINGIMSGIGNNKFSPKGTYTREQSIVTVLKLYEFMQ